MKVDKFWGFKFTLRLKKFTKSKIQIPVKNIRKIGFLSGKG